MDLLAIVAPWLNVRIIVALAAPAAVFVEFGLRHAGFAVLAMGLGVNVQDLGAAAVGQKLDPAINALLPPILIGADSDIDGLG